MASYPHMGPNGRDQDRQFPGVVHSDTRQQEPPLSNPEDSFGSGDLPLNRNRDISPNEALFPLPALNRPLTQSSSARIASSDNTPPSANVYSYHPSQPPHVLHVPLNQESSARVAREISANSLYSIPEVASRSNSGASQGPFGGNTFATPSLKKAHTTENLVRQDQKFGFQFTEDELELLKVFHETGQSHNTNNIAISATSPEAKELIMDSLKNGHPIWLHCRQIQGKLEMVRQRVNQTPGVSSHLSQEVSVELQQIGQLVNQAVMKIVTDWASEKLVVGQLRDTISNWNQSTVIKLDNLGHERDDLQDQVQKLQSALREKQESIDDKAPEMDALYQDNFEIRCKKNSYGKRIESLQEESIRLMREFQEVMNVVDDRSRFEKAKDDLFRKIFRQVSNKESLFSLLDDKVSSPPPNNDYHLLEQCNKSWKTRQILNKQKSEAVQDETGSLVSENPPSTLAGNEDNDEVNSARNALVHLQMTPTTVYAGSMPQTPRGQFQFTGPGVPRSTSGPMVLRNHMNQMQADTGGYLGHGNYAEPNTPTNLEPPSPAFGPGHLGGFTPSPAHGNANNRFHGPNNGGTGRGMGRGMSSSGPNIPSTPQQPQRSASAFRVEGTPNHVPAAVPPSPFPPGGGGRGIQRPASVHPGARQTQFNAGAPEFRPQKGGDNGMVLYNPGFQGRGGPPQQLGAPHGNFGGRRTSNSGPNKWQGPNYPNHFGGSNMGMAGFKRPATRMGNHGPGDGNRFGNGGNASRSNSNQHLVQNSRGPVIHNVEPTYQNFVRTIHEAVSELYTMIGGWVKAHCPGMDNRQLLMVKASDTFPKLLACYTPMTSNQAAGYVDIHLRDGVYRPCLLSRLLLTYFTRMFWATNAGWIGYNQEMDSAIQSLNYELNNLNFMPPYQRRVFCGRRADIISHIVDAPDYPGGFRPSRIGYYTNEVMKTIQPLVSRLAEPSSLEKDTRLLVEQAWQISEVVSTSRLQWSFRFPDAGDRFMPNIMEPTYPSEKEAEELHKAHWRVALVITPIITIIRDTGDKINTHDLFVAETVCMQ